MVKTVDFSVPFWWCFQFSKFGNYGIHTCVGKRESREPLLEFYIFKVPLICHLKIFWEMYVLNRTTRIIKDPH